MRYDGKGKGYVLKHNVARYYSDSDNSESVVSYRG